jgi:hypothetical protein
MNQLFVPLVLAMTALAFVLTFLFTVKNIKRKYGLSRVNSSMIKMRYSEQAEKEAKDIIAAAGFPVALDLAVEHLGKVPDIYITTEKKFFSRLKKLAGKNALSGYEIKEEDYLVFHPGGFYEVLTGEMDKEDALQTEFKAIDLSKVNEIGEGAAIRMVFAPKKKANIVMFFSAPSQFQLREIVESAVSPFKGRGCRIPKDKEAVIAEFNSPDFIYRAAR